ncbi:MULTISPECIES: type VI secretion system baseplate subunit TssG [unclassified Pseudomonas]|uniref:type VI secretion system baseplate subunit TssG n=1 Tax=unclassified Pseudomonas TaxID=196821 RepID=UPI000BC5CDBB|nr:MULTISPECIES: type VI secretion system baseplate subunit TssG [unclassified Pseudomonas]PVZ19636.1 type VI secretion system protein ImpH [Pseudomonas sp. URIL14HWK12:I12]PVZ22779.1 type VI secretion system protein ImpH [Pseudomonas sp. URIL14HWK12:I10]PVZ37591.1 type VI secretion system protein ImpH [Pseudomonas sp. URIL14HWK12:I11]SNZ15202.1 type VI secretion system protein ImpH [Pseudomonas sp. URIL14HWK12:I9]
MSVEALLEALAPRLCEASLWRVCQLIEQSAPQAPALGSTLNPADDPVRFLPWPGLGFPAAEWRGLETGEGRVPVLRTRLLGLYGVDSPLPAVYLADISQGGEGHEALQGFLDLFSHRLFTQFYRAWRKYSYPATFQAGGQDPTSQCLLSLIGLGTPGSAGGIGAPASRFLGLLAALRLPTRTAEGLNALVRLLAPQTRTEVTACWPRTVWLASPATLGGAPVSLGQGMPLGPRGLDATSQVLLTLHAEQAAEVLAWLPGEQRLADLLVLLRMYLGWRCNARLGLSLPSACLPAAHLGRKSLRLGMTALLGPAARASARVRIDLGLYQGLQPLHTVSKDIHHVAPLPY